MSTGLTAELKPLCALRWAYLIVDEAHRIKNPRTKLVGTLRCLRAAHCTLLTGTPVSQRALVLARIGQIAQRLFAEGGERFAHRSRTMSKSCSAS